MPKIIHLSLSLFLTLVYSLSAAGQRENSTWYFGQNAAINFPVTGSPSAVTGSAMNTYEACASVADPAGQLLFYTNGDNIWNRNNQLMVNGTNLGGHNSTTQGATIVRSPANPQQYYVFVLDATENYLAGGLKYAVVDMTLQGGLGAVATSQVQVSTALVTERLTTVPHANGRDTWVLVHGWQTSTFYAYLLTASGLQTTAVTTTIGSVHAGGGGAHNNANAAGYLRASPDGRKLALGTRDSNFELFDFDAATGLLSNYLPLTPFYRSYGVAFSPNGRLLYGTNLDGLGLYQYDLLAGSAAAVAGSGLLVARPPNTVGAVQAGPDGKLYVSVFNSAYLAVIDNPDVRGTGCGFRANAVYLNGALAQVGLPNYPASAVAPPTLTASFTPLTACAGSPVTFTGTASPASAATTATWDFGDPASGSANSATGFAPTHTYAAAGTYQVSLQVANPSLPTPVTVTQVVTVAPLPSVTLGADTTFCGSQLVLRANPQPAGSTYRWQDGSTLPTLLVRASGTYQLTVTSAAGCSSVASRRVTLNAPPTPRLPADTTACTTSVLLRPGNQPAGSTYSWQDGSTGATYVAQVAGTYTVRVVTPQGCVGTATSRVHLGIVPIVTLGADTVVCPNSVWVLRTNLQPAGTLYRWQDGSTAATYQAHGPGQYAVEVRVAATGCMARATLLATSGNCPITIPNVITPNGDAQNEFFVLKGLNPSDWHISIFDRWGRQVYDREQYDNRWNATGEPGGLYYYLLRKPATSERYQGWVQVVRSN